MAKKMAKNVLVIIDPQCDFAHPKGALFVPGAWEDSERLADVIDRNTKRISNVYLTLDSHDEIDIAHGVFWVDSNGNHPQPFTIITAEDVRKGTWSPAQPLIRIKWGTETKTLREHAIHYTEQLEARGRNPLCIWPPHCVIGKTTQIPLEDDDGNPVTVNGQTVMTDFCGYGIVRPISEAIIRWEHERFRKVNFVTKGSNPMTEHYSAVEADVPDPSDLTTQVNSRFIELLEKVGSEGGKLFFSGQAKSHCVRQTMQDIMSGFNDSGLIKNMWLIEDTCSNVPGFENFGEDFVDEFKNQGGHTINAADVTM